MALQLQTLGRMMRAHVSRAPHKSRAESVRLASRKVPESCNPAANPPCEPCVPPPRPPCRARPAARIRALRELCCPPPSGHRPPCVPPPPNCALTCDNSHRQRSQIADDSCRKHVLGAKLSEAPSCGAESDRVARRLAAARLARRSDYEREVAARPAARCVAAPLPRYTLGHERECARATDGRDYTVTGDAPPRSPAAVPRCGPGRVPPPPRCVELLPDNDCQIRARPHLDPCAHHPRVLVDVDRTENSDASAKIEQTDRSSTPDVSTPASAGAQSAPSKQNNNSQGLTSRLMKTLNLGRAPTFSPGNDKAAPTSCPRKRREAQCKKSGARHARDPDWCASMPTPAPAPPRCRERTLAERLRAHAGPCGRPHPVCETDSSVSRTKRKFHTSANFATVKKGFGDVVAETKSNAAKLKIMLKERMQLQECGRGRSVCSRRMTGVVGDRTSALPRLLDLRVPASAGNVRVQVSLEDNALLSPHVSTGIGGTQDNTGSVAHSSSYGQSSSTNKSDSWLSIKNLQKKLSECRRNESKENHRKVNTEKSGKSEKSPGPHSGTGKPPVCPPANPTPQPSCPLPRSPDKSPSCPQSPTKRPSCPSKPAKSRTPTQCTSLLLII